MDPLRRHAVKVLVLFDQGNAQLKNVRDVYCKKYDIAGIHRQRLTALTNDVIRWRGRLDNWLSGLLNKPNRKITPELKNILRAGIYEVVMDKKTPVFAAVDTYVEIAKKILGAGQGKLTNALLRKSAVINSTEKPENSSLNKWYSFPRWLWEKWVKQFGEDKTISLANYFNEKVKIDIRRIDTQLSNENLQSYCKKNDIVIKPWNNSSIFYNVQHNMSAMQHLIKSKYVSVQDRAAGMVVELLDPKPGETILDVCAAPGTKAAYIAELMKGKGELYVSDVKANRMEKFEPVFKNVIVAVKNAEKNEFPMADAILIDAPCSGTGVIGKKPDIRWRRTFEQVYDFVKHQKSILNHMGQFVKPGGRIIYSTCSIEPEENWGVVDAFLKLNADYFIDMEPNNINDSWRDERGALAPLPFESKTDGMFAVSLTHGPE